ncbi:hypothetical protein J7E96_16785 [Streptomyces sp. ISL-96]|uniref:hypothetical protein n=1 Tax=Streptomyces sp. ISL-96 TaxID=2819191 RepID=UPI001BE6FC9E|nr:hypothetical protein [Streptomyces sp. ISL-96]MBT2490144.1 hypothetical protein [Streptomyces sp. ISL-96]
MQLFQKFDVGLVIDAGAHAGGYGTMLRRSGYRGRMVSFEPLTGRRAELHRRAASDRAWAVLPCALGDHSGTVTGGWRQLPPSGALHASPAVINVADNAGASSSVLPMLGRHRAAYLSEQTASVPAAARDAVTDGESAGVREWYGPTGPCSAELVGRPAGLLPYGRNALHG